MCSFNGIYVVFVLSATIYPTDGQHSANNKYRTHVQPQRATVDIKEKIIEFQCHAQCAPETDQHCHKQCMLDVMHQPRRGQCPNAVNTLIFKNISPVEKLSCLDECSYDYDCPEIQKCCKSSCGPICTDPIGIHEDTLLPPIPKILSYKLSRSHKVELTLESSINSTHYWYVEVRSHIGSLFSPRKLGTWHWQHVVKISETTEVKSTRTVIYFNLRPGRWYVVRVAAINEYGFRGYSEPSKPFTLKHNPKPPKAPSDLKVVSKQTNDRNVSARIVWCPSKSNLPIEKYKIIWSLYVRLKDESLITNEVYVKDSHQFEITNLKPDSSYYIQVQATSISGSRRLKSEKTSILFNTTVLPLEQYEPLQCSAHHLRQPNRKPNKNSSLPISALNITHRNNDTTTVPKKLSYDVRFRMNRKFGMIAQISGFGDNNYDLYELCIQNADCDMRSFIAIRARKNALEFSKLQYNTTYVLKNMQQNSVITEPSEIFTFSTPKCENVRKRFPEMQLKC